MSAADPFCLMRDAGTGSLSAQRALADMALALAGNPSSDIDPYTVLVEGAVFARMAAAHGEAEDQRRCLQFAGLITSMCGETSAIDVVAEGIARAELLADDGCEDCATLLVQHAHNMTPEILALAKSYVERLRNERNA